MQFSGKLVIIAALAVTVLLVSNIIAIKPVALFELPFNFIGNNLFVVSAAIICFPIGYIISDILTEVYGFRVARGVIWLGFLCNLLMVFLFWAGDLIPGAVFWSHEPVTITDDAGNVVANLPSEHAYEAILGATGWIMLGSFVAYLVGEFTNAVVMVLLKNRTQGRMLWLRTISSTVVGQGIDSILFFTIAFGISGLWVGPDGSWLPVFNAAVCAWIAKSLYEIIATPLTYLVVGWLKRTERMDAYDVPRSLNPFGVFGSGPDANAAVGRA
ncbi:MAG: queuosine precursor transporter [Chloroflexi bacterium]|nr:queuosine precursor transporter [Chloroflexota bacterium]